MELLGDGVPVKWPPSPVAAREGGSWTLGVERSRGGAGRRRILVLDAKASGVAKGGVPGKGCCGSELPE